MSEEGFLIKRVCSRCLKESHVCEPQCTSAGDGEYKAWFLTLIVVKRMDVLIIIPTSISGVFLVHLFFNYSTNQNYVYLVHVSFHGEVVNDVFKKI